jgi:hypothetical protein
VFTPARTEAVTYGLSLTTGDYGDQSVELQMMVLRIVCLNLAIGYQMLRKIHLGARFQSDEDLIDFSKETLELDAKTISSAVGDIVDNGAKQIEWLDKRIGKAAEEVTKDQLKTALVKLNKKESKDLTKEVEDMLISTMPQALPAGKSEWR